MHFGESVICYVMQFPTAILTAGLFIAAQSQLFDKSVIEDGGSFNLTCDASRIGDVPAAVTEINQLTVERSWVFRNHTTFALIANYSLIPLQSFTLKVTPGLRPWVINASGGNYPSALDNRATIKIILYVTDAQCFDAGLYICKARFNTTGGVSEASRSETITFKFKARMEVPVITLDQHNGNAPDVSTYTVGQDVQLTCTLEVILYRDYAGLELTWLTGPSGGTNFMPYPMEGIQMLKPSPPDHPCEHGKFASILTFNVPAVDTMYICVAKDGDNGETRKNFTIVPKTSTVNNAAHLGIMDSNWFVRNKLAMMAASLMGSRFV